MLSARSQGRSTHAPVMKKNGGYWISSDHSVPESVSLETFRQFVALAKELGSYE